MAFSQTEFELILADPSKAIEGDIKWSQDEDHSHCLEFKAKVISNNGYPLSIKGSYNPAIPALTYALIHSGVGRIYGLCHGKGHHNPTCEQVERKHKHSWTDIHKDKRAYVPPDINAPANDPVKVWREFCEEAKIKHEGAMEAPPPLQGELF